MNLKKIKAKNSKRKEGRKPGKKRGRKKGITETVKDTDKKEEGQSKKKSNIPSIVLEGVPEDHKGLTGMLRGIIKDNFNVKYTNTSTIVINEDKIDYENLLGNVKKEEMACYAYTSKNDKSHVFVIRGLNDGTKMEDLEEDLMKS